MLQTPATSSPHLRRGGGGVAPWQKKVASYKRPKDQSPQLPEKQRHFLVAADPMRCHPFGLVASDQSLIHTFKKIPSKEHDVHPKKERYKISL